MQPCALEFPLVLGRLLSNLREETRASQRVFSAEVGVGEGTLAWIEAGRSNAYAAQVFSIERGLIARGVLTQPGQVFALLHLLVAALAEREVGVTHGRVATLSDHDSVAALDRIVGTVVQGFLDRGRGRDPAIVTSVAGGIALMAILAGPVTQRKRRRGKKKEE